MVEINALNFGYGTTPLFTELDLSLTPGNVYGLLGLNGAGKSSLLNLTAGLLFPDSGTISALSREPARREPRFLADVFVLPEEMNVPGISGVRYIDGLAPFYPAFDRHQLDRYLEEFSIDAKSRLTTLSLGQKKKFLLSFGLASNARLVLLDEPTNGLDIPSKGLFRRLVAEAVSENRIFVISTHQVRDVESLIDPLVILHQGKVLLNETLSTIASAIHMTHSPRPPGDDTPGFLYCEPAVGGYWTIWEGGSEGGLIELEILFNSVVSDPQTYVSILDRSKGAR